ncbi:hypothetical protein BH10CYA1_BH10CYA1_60190 [soil metagenome]
MISEDPPIKLLVIQDSPEDLTAVLDALHAASSKGRIDLHSVDTLASGLEQLLNGNFDAVLLDLTLSAGAGLQSLIKLRNASNAVPIIILTTMAEQEMALEALQNGAQDYILKDAPTSEVMHRQIRFAIERKRADETSRRLMLLEQREHFIGMLAHDLRNPLIGGMRVLEMVLAGAVGNLSQSQSDLLSSLSNSNRQQLLLINNVLDTYRLEQGGENFVLSDTNLASIVAECVREILPIAFSKNIEVLNSCEEDCAVHADRLAMRRVLSNLLSNAIKFTPAKGKIEIKLVHKDGNAVLTVRDTGIGIEATQLERLFERFYQADSSYRRSGLGLGLHLCKELIDAQKGTISCTSEPQRGTVFTISLPLEDVLRKNFLIVDKNPRDAKVLTDLLQLHCIDAVTVQGGKEAVHAIAKSDFEAVFISVRAPVESGLKTSAAIRAAGIKVPIIACITRLSAKQRAIAKAAGVTEILQEPITDKKLELLVNKLVALPRKKPLAHPNS